MVVLAEATTTTTNNNNNNNASSSSSSTTTAGEGFQGSEGAHKERAHPAWQVVPIDWQGVPIEEVS